MCIKWDCGWYCFVIGGMRKSGVCGSEFIDFWFWGLIIMNFVNFVIMDLIMLMSIINMKLCDDFGGDLDKLVNYFDIDCSVLEVKLVSVGFEFLL